MDRMNRSTAALIIAILFHLLIILFFVLLGMMVPEIKQAEPEETHRIKVSLKERPEVVEEALIQNRIKEPKKAPPMPKGKQLEAIVTQPLTVKPESLPIAKQPPITKQPVIRKEPPEPSKTLEKTHVLPPKIESYILPEEPAEPVKKKQPQSPPKDEGEHEKLYSLLSQEIPAAMQPAQKTQKQKREGRINEHIKEAYGDAFGKLSEGEQKYILDNQEVMRRITQEVLNRVGRVNIPDSFRTDSYNLIEFYLYPSGDISEIKFIKRSGFYILDDTTRETIEYAYSRYPRPDQKTLIRYRVGYYLRGY